MKKSPTSFYVAILAILAIIVSLGYTTVSKNGNQFKTQLDVVEHRGHEYLLIYKYGNTQSISGVVHSSTCKGFH